MSASLEFLDSDNTTVITTLNQGNIATPGSSSNKKLYVKNNGDVTAQSVTVALEQVGSNDGYLYEQIATDSGGTPGTFGTTDISLGSIAASASTAFWVKVSLITGLTADSNPRRSNLVAQALTL